MKRKPIKEPICPLCKIALEKVDPTSRTDVGEFSRVSNLFQFMEIVTIERYTRMYDLYECSKCGFTTFWRVKDEDNP